MAQIGSVLDEANEFESQYMDCTRHAVMVLEGLGLDADVFAKLFADPGGIFGIHALQDRHGQGSHRMSEDLLAST